MVSDPSGAVISKVAIRIFKARSVVGKEFFEAKSDAEGRFSTNLVDGDYLALFESPGFVTEIIPFQVETRGWGSLGVTMDIGAGMCGGGRRYSSNSKVVRLE